MPDILASKVITAPKFRFVRRGVIWSFKDNPHNPVMQEKLRQGRYAAALSPDGVTLQSEDKRQSWQVPFDPRGFILRGNGLRHRVNDSPVNALHRSKTQERIYLSFWDLVFQRDRAPIENRQEIDLIRFNQALKMFISDGNEFIYQCYLRAQVGKRGEVMLRKQPTHSLLWGLALARRHAGEKVIVAPLQEGEQLTLGVYNSDGQEHLYTYHFDLEQEQFYALRARGGSVLNDFFTKVTAARHFSHRGLDYYFNSKAVQGDIYVIEESGTDLRVRRGDQTKALPAYPITVNEQPTAYLLGDVWPTRPLPVTGQVEKAVSVLWNPRARDYQFRLFGRLYRLTTMDTIRLNNKKMAPVFVTAEKGLVTEVRSRSSEQVIYYRTIRDENWRLLGSSRSSIAKSHFQDGVRIIEGLETTEHRGFEGVLVGRHFLSLGQKTENHFSSRPVSVVIAIKDNSVKIIYRGFLPRFTAADRTDIDALLLLNTGPDSLAAFRIKSRQRCKALAFHLGRVMNGHLPSVNIRLANLQALFESKEVSAHDIVALVDIIYELSASENEQVATRFLEVFSRLFQVLDAVGEKNPVKIRMALSMMRAFPELERTLELIGFNRQSTRTSESDAEG